MAEQTNDRFRKFFDDNDKPMLLDGATGTELMKMGLNPSPFLNLDNPEKVRGVHLSYFNAGSDAVLTNTFGAISTRLKRQGLESSVYNLNKIGAEIARTVCPRGKFVLGNIGPSGDVLEPYGTLPRNELIEAYSEQIRRLLDGGVDGFSLETFADLNEMQCAITAIKNSNTNLPYLCSMTFKPTHRGYYTEMGVSIPRAIETLVSEGAFAVGSNCGCGILNMIEIARLFRQSSSSARLIFQPNAGSPSLVDGKDVYDETPEFFRAHLPKLLSYKPSIIGGCCGTTPKHIKVMRDFLDKN